MKHAVLVPGFWHGSWCWSLVSAELAGRRIPSVAVDLQGQGLGGRSPASYWRRPFSADEFASEPSPVRGVTATTAAHHLIDQLHQIGGGDACVVVAHSMGGAVATLAAELEPSLFSHLVYVAAFAPVDGSPAGAYVVSEGNAGELGTALLRADPNIVGASRLDTGDVESHAAIRDALYGDVERSLADSAITLLNADAPVGIAAEPVSVTAERFGSVARTYVLCRQDFMARPQIQREMIGRMDAVTGARTIVVEVDSSHSPFLSQPGTIAGVIAQAWG